MSYESLDLSVENGLARVTLNQPDIGNPFNDVCSREWAQLANELTVRTDVRAILLQARGRYFSVGGDLSMFAGHLDQAPKVVMDNTAGLHMGMARLARLNAPIIASVHGTAMGGAVSVIANCDLVFAARSAKLGVAYAHIGFTCDLGASYGFASRMGIGRARRFLLMGEVLSADEALQAGLVDYVTDDDAVAAQAEAAAIKLAQGPTRAYGEVRRLLMRSLGNSYESQLEDEAQALTRVAATHDAREGLAAFLDKRKPKFQGR